MLVRNSIAQLTGRLSSLVANLVGVPVYLAYLDVEAYGVVGIYLSLQAFFGLIDLGLPITANRQISISLSQGAPLRHTYVIARSFEAIFLLISLCGYLALSVLAAPIADHWLTPKGIDRETIRQALELAALAAALRFPCAFYSNALFAFERHVVPNLISGIAAFARVGAVILFMEVGGEGLVVFFYAQIVVNLLEMLSLLFLFWCPSSGAWLVRPDFRILRDGIGLTSSMTGISLAAFALSQADKVILSRVLSLDDFGIYSVAFSVAISVLPIAYAVGSAVFPSLSREAAVADDGALATKLKDANRLILVLAGSYALFLITQVAIFGDLVGLLTGKVADITMILPWMAGATLLQSLTVLPHASCVAMGRPKLILVINSAHILPYCVSLYYMGQHFSALGASISYFLLNASACLILWCGMVRQSRGKFWKTEIGKTALILASGLALGLLMSFGMAGPTETAWQSVYFSGLAFIGILVFMAAVSAPGRILSTARAIAGFHHTQPRS